MNKTKTAHRYAPLWATVLTTALAASQAPAHELRDTPPAQLDLAADYDLKDESATSVEYVCPTCWPPVTFTIEYLRADDPGIINEVTILRADNVQQAPLHLIRDTCATDGCSVSLSSDAQEITTLTIETASQGDLPTQWPTLTHFIAHGDDIIRLQIVSPELGQAAWVDEMARRSLIANITQAHAP